MSIGRKPPLSAPAGAADLSPRREPWGTDCARKQPRQGRKKTGVAHTLTLLLVHVVFSTKERRPWLDPDLRTETFAYLGGIARETGATALAINGTVDHIHLFLAQPPTLATAELVRLLKTNSSLWLHRTHPKTHAGFAWQTGYGAFSVSHSSKDTVTEYIAKQEKHHQRMSFAEEYIALLKKHGVDYDERFVLD